MLMAADISRCLDPVLLARMRHRARRLASRAAP